MPKPVRPQSPAGAASASARAIATRCLSPPLRSHGSRAARSGLEPDLASSGRHLASRSGRVPREWASMGSSRCAAPSSSGRVTPKGSWNMIWNSLRLRRSASGRSAARSMPSNLTLPDVGTSRRTAHRASVLLPQPDSPTIAQGLARGNLQAAPRRAPGSRALPRRSLHRFLDLKQWEHLTPPVAGNRRRRARRTGPGGAVPERHASSAASGSAARMHTQGLDEPRRAASPEWLPDAAPGAGESGYRPHQTAACKGAGETRGYSGSAPFPRCGRGT